jgi:hypothetical protein
MTPDHRRARAWLLTVAAAAGIAVGAAGIASAATDSGSSSAGNRPAANGYQQAPPAQDGSRPDPATMKNGPGETLLTGDTADKVKAAALESVPGGTIIRVETDSEGSPYEAHVRKADGTEVTVKVDQDFKVTATEDGFGRGPAGHAPPNGQAPAGGPARDSNRDTGATA